MWGWMEWLMKSTNITFCWQFYFISHLFFSSFSLVSLIPWWVIEAPCGRGTVEVPHSPSLHVGLPHIPVEVDGGGDVPVHNNPLLIVETFPSLSCYSISPITFTSARHWNMFYEIRSKINAVTFLDWSLSPETPQGWRPLLGHSSASALVWPGCCPPDTAWRRWCWR